MKRKEFPLIKLAKKLKGARLGNDWWAKNELAFPLIKLAKKLKV